MDARRSQRLLDALFTTETMRGIFSDHGRLQGMLDFEAALARAEARVNLISAGAAAAIGAQCRAELFDVDALAAAAAHAGNAAIPLVRELTRLVAGQYGIGSLEALLSRHLDLALNIAHGGITPDDNNPENLQRDHIFPRAGNHNFAPWFKE